jgi:hypothetical protein
MTGHLWVAGCEKLYGHTGVLLICLFGITAVQHAAWLSKTGVRYKQAKAKPISPNN